MSAAMRGCAFAGVMVAFALTRSRSLAIALCAAHAAAAVLVFPLEIDPAAKVLLWALAAVSLAQALLRHAMLVTRGAVVSARIGDGSRATVQLRTGERLECALLGTSYVSPALCVLNVRVPGERLARHVLLVPDNVDHEDYRRLRVALKWARGRDGDGAPAKIL